MCSTSINEIWHIDVANKNKSMCWVKQATCILISKDEEKKQTEINMMVLSEMVRSRSSSFKRSFRKKSENICEQFSSNGKTSATKTQSTASGGE